MLVALIGALGTLAWLCFTRAFALADASAVMPYEFLKLPITAALAYLMFAEVPSVWTWLGGAVIFGASIYIAQREAQRRARAGRRPAPAAPSRSRRRRCGRAPERPCRSPARASCALRRSSRRRC